MKKLIMIAGLVICYSCADKTPKCDDENVKETVISLLEPEKLSSQAIELINELKDEKVDISDTIKPTLINIITNDINKELKSCGCEAKIKMSSMYFLNKGNYLVNGSVINYTLKTDSKGEIIVEVLNQ